MRRGILILLLALAACAPNPDLDPALHGFEPAAEPNLLPAEGLDVRTETVAYYGGAQGFLAQPVEGVHPGVVMIHEWWGLNDNIKSMATLLAAEGYTVLAVDLYNGNVATTPDEARSFMAEVAQDDAVQNMQAAAAYLRNAGAEKIASLGWCFGGGQSLQFGLNEELDATVIYYGRLVTEEERLSSLTHPVLGIFAELDGGIPVSSVESFDAALDSLGVENDIHIYPGVDHAFANPSGDRYSKEAAEDAWEKTTAFLAAHLQ